MKSLLALIFAGLLLAAPSTTLRFDSSGSIEVLGSSNVRSWSCTTEQFAGTMEAILDGQVLASVTGVDLTMSVNSLDCGQRQLTTKVRETLAKGSNLIRFSLDSAEVSGNQIHAQGTLTAAGGTRPTEIIATATPSADGQLRLTGEVEFRMTDFGIDPPTAMLGSLRAHDEVTVTFDVIVVP